MRIIYHIAIFTFPETQEYDPRGGIGTINPVNKTVPFT